MVKDELGALAGLVIFLEVRFALPWSPVAYMTDASPSGYGVLVTAAKVEELRQEAPLGGYGGWTLQADRIFEELERDPEQQLAQAVQRLPLVPLPRSLRSFRIATYFLGLRQEGDIEDFLTKMMARLGCLALVDHKDLAEGGTAMDFSRDDVVERLAWPRVERLT